MSIPNEVFEVQMRILIEDLLCRGHTKRQIYSAMSQSELRATKSQVDVFIAEIVKEWHDEAEPIREQQRAKHRRMAERLYSKAFADKKYSTCVNVLRLMTELDGTLSPARVSVSLPRSKDGQDPEFEDRSKSELDYFATHGEWPGGTQSAEVH